MLAETVVILHQGRVEKLVDVKAAPYRDGEGRDKDRFASC